MLHLLRGSVRMHAAAAQSVRVLALRRPLRSAENDVSVTLRPDELDLVSRDAHSKDAAEELFDSVLTFDPASLP
jgi:hypothetical protein